MKEKAVSVARNGLLGFVILVAGKSRDRDYHVRESGRHAHG
jgi:hypothetical protein